MELVLIALILLIVLKLWAGPLALLLLTVALARVWRARQSA